MVKIYHITSFYFCIWICGTGILPVFVDLWICGFVDLWICGTGRKAWICGFVDLWICGTGRKACVCGFVEQAGKPVFVDLWNRQESLCLRICGTGILPVFVDLWNRHPACVCGFVEQASCLSLWICGTGRKACLCGFVEQAGKPVFVDLWICGILPVFVDLWNRQESLCLWICGVPPVCVTFFFHAQAGRLCHKSKYIFNIYLNFYFSYKTKMMG
jgi:hypothetical protein